jgi:hypothetical protein
MKNSRAIETLIVDAAAYVVEILPKNPEYAKRALALATQIVGVPPRRWVLKAAIALLSFAAGVIMAGVAPMRLAVALAEVFPL